MKNLLLLLCTLMIALQVQGQSIKLRGNIKSFEDDLPLPGATVLIKGTTNGTISDLEGNYSLAVSESDTLIFSFIGFNAEVVAVAGQTVIDVMLMPGLGTLSEVVVTALGVKREKRALGYAVSEVSGDQLSGNGEPNPISSIAGKVAGVNISSTTAGPTGSSRVVIRGIRELQGNNQPLYVIDGVPSVNGNIGSATKDGGFDLGDGLSDLNPNNIESISVLKGASAAALYGSRALNGVILITTKKGSAKQGLGLEYNSSLTIDQVSTRLDDRQTIYGQGNDGGLPLDASAAGNISDNWGPRFTDASEIIQRDGSIRPYKYIDNNVQDFFRDGKTWMNSVALTGGNNDNKVRFSYSNVTSTDIIPNSGYDRNTFDVFAAAKVIEGLTIDAKASYMVEDVKNRPALTDAVNNIGNGLLGLAGNFDQAWLKNYANPDGSYINYSGDPYRANPYWTLNRTSNESAKERVNGYLSMNYEINELFNVNVKAGTDFYSFVHENFYDRFTPTYDGGVLEQINMNVQETNVQGLLNFRKELSADFRLSASLGGNLMKFRSHGDRITGSEIIQAGVSNLLNFQQLTVQPFDDGKEIQSVFGTTEVAFREYLFLNLQGRNDWASTLAPGDVSYFYPSADLSFVLTDAMDLDIPALSFGKVRASLGQVGSDFTPYGTSFAYGLTGRSMYGNSFGEILNATIPNPNLRPQIKTSFELGTDIRLWQNRVGLDLTYYNEITDDVLLELPVPSSTGYERAALNAAKMKNTGVEILLNTTPVILSNGFRWELSLNYAKNYNTVVDLYEGLEVYEVESARWAGATIVAREGQPFGTIMGAGYLRDDQGRIIHNSSTGIPMRTDQPVELGNSLPDWTGGFINTFSYKGLTFKAAVDVKMGGDLFSMTNMAMHTKGTHGNTADGRDSWNEYMQERRAAQDAGLDPETIEQNGRGYIGEGVNEEGGVNTVPVSPAEYWRTVGSNIPEPFIYDASYAKLRDVGLTYTFDKASFGRLPFQSVSIGVIGRNLLVLYKNTPNIDPESTYNNGNGQGFEYGSLPGRRRFGFNLNIRL